MTIAGNAVGKGQKTGWHLIRNKIPAMLAEAIPWRHSPQCAACRPAAGRFQENAQKIKLECTGVPHPISIE
jgi:hypothetical protein